MSDLDDVLRVASDDILYRLRAEERERAEAIKRWHADACRGSIRDDDNVHELVRDAAAEIIRLRLALKQAG